MYFFLALLGLHCSARAFSNCGSRVLFNVLRLLTVAASLVAEAGSGRHANCDDRVAVTLAPMSRRAQNKLMNWPHGLGALWHASLLGPEA